MECTFTLAMAPKEVIVVTSFVTLSLLLLLLPIATCRSDLETKFGKLKETNMVFYMHDQETGVNVTATPVGGIPNKRWWILGFGTLYVTADLLTEKYDRNSTQVGRASGLYVNSAVDGSDLHLLLSLVFTNKAFNGSTLEIQGSNRFLNHQREVSVVSGTGKFRMARGYAILETVFLDLVNSNAIVKINLTAFHY